jgi:hypothetical protein
MTERFGKTHPWVTEDGIYDSRKVSCRYHIVNGRAIRVYSKVWVDMNDPKEEPHYMLPFGHYPDLPEKPKK